MSSSFSAIPPTQPHRAARRDASGAYRLVRTPPGPVDPPVLDAAQRAVVDHRHGPLLVLAGPGTGKTTTLVESVAQRVRAGGDPERILVLTFSRKAAVALRDKLAARLGPHALPRGLPAQGGPARRGGVPQATTFHSFCYALVRAHQDADLFADPLRLLSGPEQDLVVRELLEGQAELAAAGLRPGALARRAARLPDHPRLRRRGPRGARPQPRTGPRPRRARRLRTAHRQARLERRGRLPRRIPRRPGRPGRTGLRRAGAPRGAARRAHRRRGPAGRRLRRRLRRRIPGHRRRPGPAAAGPGRPPRGAHARRPGPHPRRLRRPRPVDLRLPGRRHQRHPRIPPDLPAGRRLPGARRGPAHLAPRRAPPCWRPPGN